VALATPELTLKRVNKVPFVVCLGETIGNPDNVQLLKIPPFDVFLG
jgi:hypothetical protein